MGGRPLGTEDKERIGISMGGRPLGTEDAPGGCPRGEDLSTAWVDQIRSLGDPFGPWTGKMRRPEASTTAFGWGRTGAGASGSAPGLVSAAA